MGKKKTGLITDEVRELINEVARETASMAYIDGMGGEVNYFRAMESLLFNYKKLAALPRIMDRHLFPLGPVDQDIVDLFGIILKGSIQVKMVLFGQGVQDRPGKASLLGAGLPAQDCNGPLLDA